MTVGIVDYGCGNLFSLKSSLARVLDRGQSALVSGNADELGRCDKLILPGVGAFGDAAKLLRSSGLDGVVISAAQGGTPVLGICLGMQLLFDSSEEYGVHGGLSLVEGKVVAMRPYVHADCKIPHIGWNELTVSDNTVLLGGMSGRYVYFVHSFMARTAAQNVSATTDYGGAAVVAAVERKNVFGVQFHPEKSGDVGLEILERFARLA